MGKTTHWGHGLVLLFYVLDGSIRCRFYLLFQSKKGFLPWAFYVVSDCKVIRSASLDIVSPCALTPMAFYQTELKQCIDVFVNGSKWFA